MECDGNKEVNGDSDEGGGQAKAISDKEGNGDSNKGGGQQEGNGNGGQWR